MEVTAIADLSAAPLIAQGLPGLSNQQIVLILVIVGVSALLLITTRRRIRQGQNSPKAYAREQISRMRSEQSLMEDFGELMAELEQFSRQMHARLDTKFAKLDAVVRDADQRIDRLERLLHRAQGEPTLDVTVDEPQAGATSTPTPEDDPRRQAIFRLADAGLTPVQIAQETGQSVGEVELILALQKVSAGTPSSR
jgi:hypothetical protein